MATYKVSFTLTEDTETGEISPSILLSHDLAEREEDDLPRSYQQMFQMVELWMIKAGILNDSGEILNDDTDLIIEQVDPKTIN